MSCTSVLLLSKFSYYAFLNSRQIYIVKLEKMAVDSENTSWGKDAKVEDVRAMRRYNWLLRWTAFFGEVCFFVVLVLAVLVVGGFLIYGNFENAIFKDGTSLTCILDGATGEIFNVK